MADLVHFIGGPLDGQQRDVDLTLEVIEYREKERVDILPRTRLSPSARVQEGRHFYRRSIRSPSAYVYQP